jgi:hypothetical protein
MSVQKNARPLAGPNEERELNFQSSFASKLGEDRILNTSENCVGVG